MGYHQQKRYDVCCRTFYIPQYLKINSENNIKIITTTIIKFIPIVTTTIISGNIMIYVMIAVVMKEDEMGGDM